MSTQPVTFWQFGTWGRVEVNDDNEVQIAVKDERGQWVRSEADAPKLKELLDAAQEFAKKRRES